MIENIQFKIGIIGAGKIVESNHLPALLNIAGITVSWIFDKSIERSNLLSVMYGVPVITEEELEDKIKLIDICLIAVPYGVRDSYIRICAALNKCVYIEKPFAVTVHEHIAYSSLFEPADIAIGFQRRYYQMVSDIRQIIQNNLFGNLKSVTVNQGYFQIKGGAGFISNAKMSGGGVIIESAIHTLDQVLEFTNADDLEVIKVKSLSRAGIDYDTTFTTNVKAKDNIINVFGHVSTLKNLDNGIFLEFENANIHFQPSPQSKIVASKKGSREYISIQSFKKEENKATSVDASFVYFWKDYIAGIKSRIPNRTSAVSSLLTTAWIDQLYKKINQPDN